MRFNSWRRAWALTATGLGTLALAGCGRYPQSTFAPAGPVAKVEMNLFDLGLWVVIPIGVLVAGLLVYILLRFSARSGDDELPPQIEGNHKLEVGWTVAFVLILALLVVPNVHDTFFVGDPPGQAAHPVHVTVVGHQFWWEFRYPNQHVVTANELHIPVGRPIDLSLQSADVIHAFWVPELSGKTDLVPGRTNVMWIQANKPGIYSGQCAEFCGTSHANMRFTVVAQSETAYQHWLSTLQHPEGLNPTSPLAQQGKELFLKALPCSGCHTIDGTTAKGVIGPNLTGVGARMYIGAGVLRNTNANLALWLHNPGAVKPGVKMPDLHLKQSQIQALVAFLRGLK